MKSCVNKGIIFFLHVTFLPSSETLVVFNISSSHANTTLPIKRFSHDQFLIDKYSLILHALLYSEYTH